MFITGAQYMMNRFGNNKIVAKVNASNLAPQAPKATVAVKTSQPVIKAPSANEVQTATNSLPEHVYRFDTRSPEEIKAAGGFQSWGTNMNLSEHIGVWSVRDKTRGYIGTTRSTGVVDIWLDGYETGYIYIYNSVKCY